MPLEGHLETASEALTDINEDMDVLAEKAVSLKTQLKDLQEDLDDLEDDLEDLQSGKGSVGALRSDLNDLGDALGALEKTADNLKSTLGDLQEKAPSLSGGDEITVNGMTTSQIRTAVKQLNAAYDAKYKEYADAMEQAGMEPSKEEFLELWKSGLSEEQYTLWAFSKTDEYDAQLSEADSVNQLLEGFNMSVGQMQALVSALGPSTSTVLSQLSNLCGALGDSGLSGTLSQLLKNADSGMDHLRNLGQTGEDLAGKLQEVLELVETLNTTVDSYIPEAQQALADAKVLAGAAVSGTEDLHTFLSDLETLMKSSGSQLDDGTKQTLDGLAATLRQAARSLSTTGDVKSAKNNISQIIEDTWDEHTGDIDNLLNMDSTARAQSLTSGENPAPQSIQVLIRTQEIQEEDPEEPEDAAQSAAQTTFWGRVGQMFRDFWAAITGIFS